MKNFLAGLISGIILCTCFFVFYPFLKKESSTKTIERQTAPSDSPISIKIFSPDDNIHTAISASKVLSIRDSIVAFAKTLIGVPYLYGSMDPAKGFDCSGFINYVFHHFNINVPRSSYEFESMGNKILVTDCSKGDLILFTGTNPLEKTIGHIGIVIDTVGGHPQFIHSSSGKINAVTVTSMESAYYQSRFVSVVDILGK